MKWARPPSMSMSSSGSMMWGMAPFHAGAEFLVFGEVLEEFLFGVGDDFADGALGADDAGVVVAIGADLVLEGADGAVFELDRGEHEFFGVEFGGSGGACEGVDFFDWPAHQMTKSTMWHMWWMIQPPDSLGLVMAAWRSPEL